jgi:hypothetical protein
MVMAVCPKCDGKLKITDWRPNCPHCGVNLVYYGMEERLLLDADKAEAEHAKFQKKIDRAKCSFVGSKFSIARIVLSVIPIPLLLLPLAKIAFNAPFISESVSINMISFYKVLSTLDFGAVINLLSSEVLGKMFICYAVSLVSILLSFLMVFIHLVLLFLSCSPRGKSRNYTLNSLALIFAAVSTVTYSMFASDAAVIFPTVMSGSLNFGIFIYFASILLCLAINIIVFRKKIEVKYKQVYVGGIPSEEYFKLVEDGVPLDQIRAEMAKRTAAKEAEEAAKKAAGEAAVAEKCEPAEKETVTK